ncbi:AAA family ATPase [Sphingomonas montanisoli]|uniref:non-specific protein-tyrosine kinase n=1 Tax=Sphingomonas montanisoli TaxID=2606412 RepID=A0A5D9CG34_9SPHN|nr:AAA family ATPase [Sphingomonas montanisoli]TZG29121.1 AAA family ATPase [Sphingomonas montanisoli]
MDDQVPDKTPKKGRRRGGSLIERAGSVYDFEGILRARIFVPPTGEPTPIIDMAPAQPAFDPFKPAPAPELPPAPPPLIETQAPPPVALAGSGGAGAMPPAVSSQAAAEPAALPAPDIIYKTAKVDRAALIEQGFIMPDAAITALAEEFRIVKRTLLLNAIGPTALPKGRRLLICSAQANEGKTFCAVNLALSMANERDIEVLLVDGDFAKPTVLSTLGIEGPVGLMDALADPDIDVETLVIKTDVGSLAVLPSGKYTNEATELIAADRTRHVLDRLASKPNRIVLFDSPPALAASPASVLAYHVGQVLLVVQADRTGEAELRDATLLLGGCEEIQLLLNKVRFSPSSRRFGSYYGYEAPR